MGIVVFSKEEAEYYYFLQTGKLTIQLNLLQ